MRHNLVIVEIKLCETRHSAVTYLSINMTRR